MPHRDLRVLDASEQAESQVNRLIDGPSGRRMLHVDQMRRSAHAVASIISEGFGRGEGRDRARYLRMARGEAEETIRHLSANFREQRITAKQYWPVKHRFAVVVKMLTSLAQQ